MSGALYFEPSELGLELAARLLERAEKPVLLAGRGAVWANTTPALLSLCEVVPELCVASTPGAKGVFPERHARAVGVFGFSGHASARAAVSEADVLVVVGTRLFEQSSGDFHPRFRQGSLIRIDRDPKFEKTPARDIVLTGDASAVLERLVVKLETAQRELRPRAVPRSAAECGAGAIPRYTGPFSVDRHVKPQALLGALSRLAAEVPIAADAGNSTGWAIEWLERNRPRDFQVSLDWGSMGFALPAAIGISLARSGAPAIALVGDGAMAMYGGDLHTAVELEIPLVVCVLNDAGAGMVRAGSAAWLGENAVPALDYRHKINFAQYGRALGAHAETVTELAEFERALRCALERATPTVLDVHIDPSEVPPAVIQRVQGLCGAGKAGESAEGGGIC